MQDVKCTSTVLLTTHAMEEADMLGDEIGIMASGRLKAFGTSLQLKHDHGSGYSLSIVKVTADVPTEPIVAEVSGMVAEAVLRTDSGHELTISLPIDSTASFPQLFRQLKEGSAGLGIATFGLAQGTLEDVFLRLADDESDEEEEEEQGNDREGASHRDTPLPRFECAPSFRLQLEAVMEQFWINASRNKVAIFHGCIQPFFLVWLGCLFVPLVQQSLKPAPHVLECHGDTPWAGNMSLASLGQIGPAQDCVSDRPDCAFPTCDALVDSFCPRESDGEATWGLEQPMCATDVAFCHRNGAADKDGWNGVPVGATDLLYSDELYSSRRALACYYDAVSQSSEGGGGSALTTSYQSFVEKVGTNQIAGGALMGFVSNVFMIQTVFYCEEMMRLRVERVKEMLLLTGVPRRSFWVSYFLSHFAFFCVAWTIAYLRMVASEMKGVRKSIFCAISQLLTVIIYPDRLGTNIAKFQKRCVSRRSP